MAMPGKPESGKGCVSTDAFAAAAPVRRNGTVCRAFTGSNPGVAAEPSPAPTSAERAIDRALMLRGQKYCASFGFTSAHNMDGNFYQLELLEEIDKAGDCALRCQSPFHVKNTFAVSRLAEAAEMNRRYASERVSSGRIKLFMDGVIESWTALTLEEYPDRPGCFGAPNFSAPFIRIKDVVVRIEQHHGLPTRNRNNAAHAFACGGLHFGRGLFVCKSDLVSQ